MTLTQKVTCIVPVNPDYLVHVEYLRRIEQVIAIGCIIRVPLENIQWKETILTWLRGSGYTVCTTDYQDPVLIQNVESTMQYAA